MRSVFKYEVPLVDNVFTITLPDGAECLHFGNQREVPTLWALVDPNAPVSSGRFRVAGTGHDIEETNLRHVGTAQFASGSLVFHLFEVL